MSCSTWSAFRGVTRMYRAIAFACMSGLLPARLLRRSRRRRGLLGRAVAAEDPRRGELAQLVADHVFRDVHGDELVPVVDRQRVAHELGRDRRAARPGLDDAALVRLVHALDLLQELRVDEGTLL